MRFFLLLALCLSLPFLLLSQDPPIKFGKIPKEDLEMKVYPPDTSAAAVVLCDYGTVAFQFKDNDAMNVLSRHKRIKFLRRAGFEHADIEIPFYTSLMRVKNLKAQVFAPDGYSVESIPAENTTLTTEFGSYSSQVTRLQGALQIVRRLEMKPVRLPAERYGEWRNFCRDVAKSDAMKVVLVNKT